MKRIKLLLAAVLSVMAWGGAQAQSWTGSEPAEGTFFLYNVGAGKFINVGDKSAGWGTNAYLTAEYGLDFIFEANVEANGSAYNLNTQVSNGGTNYYLATALWCDGAATPWTFTKVDRTDINAYTISNGESYIVANEAGTDIEFVALSGTERDQWQIIGSTDILANLQANTAAGVKRTIATFFISDPDFGRNDLRMSNNKKVWQYTYTEGGNVTIPGRDLNLGGTGNVQNYGCEFWKNTFDIHQDLTNLPNGIYEFEIYGYGTNGTTYIYATTADGTTEKVFKNQTGAANFQTGLNNIDNYGGNVTGLVQVTDGTLTIGVKRETNSGSDWTVIDQARLYYYGDYTFAEAYGADLKDLVAEAKELKDAETSVFDTSDLAQAITDAEATLVNGTTEQDFADATAAIRDAIDTYKANNDALIAARAAFETAKANAAALKGKVPTAAYNTLDGIVANQNPADNAEELNAAVTAINEAIATANALVAPYALVADGWALYNQTDYTDANDAKATFKAVLDPFETMTEAEAITAAVESANLPAAVETFITSVTLNEGASFDVTNFFVTNPGVRTNTDGWTAEEVNGVAKNGSESWAVCKYEECEFYKQNFDFYQNITLKAGTWEFGVTGFHRAGNHSTYFYAGEDKILIPGVESSVVNTMAAAKTYFDNGNGKVALKFALEEATNSIKIGIINTDDSQTDKWTIFRDFTLKYYGAVDYSSYAERWSEAVAAANSAKENGANVTGAELTTLNAAIADAPDGTSKANYLEKTDALVAATQAFNAAIAPYNAYVAYRAETVKVFGEELAATVAAPTTAEEATTAVQNLNIAQYNKVAEDYTFSLNGLIGDFGSWTGTATVAGAEATPNYLTNEHWSGETHAYYEQASTGWGNANGWTIQYEKKCTLPEGDYVIKVAARSSAGTTSLVSCSATDVTITLPNVGAEAKGINKAGEASWTEGEFAKDGKGYGWQWRFLPFSLTKETEVTMTFYAEASTQYQWMSIADGELLSANDVATAVEFDESVDNEIEDINIANVNITRNIKVGYNTVVLPFELTANQVATAFGAGTEVYNFSENSEDPNQATINFTKGDGSIKANTPVLVKATMESPSQSFDGVKVVAPAEGAAVEGTNFVFAGVFGPLTIDEGDFFLSDNKIYKSTGLSHLNAFHAYFINKTGVENVKLFIDGIATRISDINDAAAQNGVLYNLAGQRVSKAQKGIFIQNGKKVLK